MIFAMHDDPGRLSSNEVAEIARKAHERQIAEKREEIEWLKEQDEPELGGYESVIIARILSILEAQLAELQRGWKEE